MFIFTILPILLPLAAALANVLVPIRVCQTSWYRLARLALLITVAVLYVNVPVFTTGSFTLSFSVAGLITLPPLALLYTNTGLVVGLVYIFSQLLSALVVPTSGRPHPRRILDLVLVSCVLVTCLAGNITTLCLCWMVVSAILFVRRISLAQDELSQPVYWDLFSHIGSVILLVMVAVLAFIEQRINSFGDVATLPYMVTLLMLAALLRMGLFPLPGNTQRSWVDRMAAICTGVWLLLRVASVSSQSLPGWNWLVPAIAASSVVTALLANLATKQLGRHYVIASLVGVLVLAPLLVPVAGTGIAVLGLINMVLVTSLLEQPWEGMTHFQATVFKWQKVAAITLLMGAPLSLGFLCRWELLRLLGGADQRITVILLTLSYTLVTLYLWRQLAWELRQSTFLTRLPDIQTRSRIVINWVVCGLGALFVLTMLTLGLFPSSINRLMPTTLTLPRMAQSLTEVDITTWIYLIVTAFVIPLAGAFFLYHQRSLFKLSSPFFEAIRWFTSINWLYSALGKLLGWASRLVVLVLSGIERRYLLGWVLIWMIIIIAFLVGT